MEHNGMSIHNRKLIFSWNPYYHGGGSFKYVHTYIRGHATPGENLHTYYYETWYNFLTHGWIS